MKRNKFSPQKHSQSSDIILSECFNKSFLPYLKNKNRYLMLFGGAGSGKSMFAAQKIIYRILTERNHKFLILRKVARTIRNSQFSLLKSLAKDRDTYDLFDVRDSDMKIISKKYNSEIISAGIDDREKLKSINGITGIWIEEATELDSDDFLQIDLRLRGVTKSYKQIICTYNPVNAHHWLNKISLNDSCYHKSTYLNNKFIDEKYKSILNDLKNTNENYFKIYALGETILKFMLLVNGELLMMLFINLSKFYLLTLLLSILKFSDWTSDLIIQVLLFPLALKIKCIILMKLFTAQNLQTLN